ncbi:GNAT family N-acetyltransferase [Alkalihalobacillus pseudalcaliphilus]|uniref:GNAT family N-acetyltransferase n=1 Tax=Alkalihalobacillus pseudalcaliphilus TaxID=79884 RepID=UPI00064DD321|nr:GNAT family N-acetyltransferase [Alkalihalobacillus pseudalcaliphilus]KMK75793.1 acetyltransferase [Alkalihalobacillus pseudalcaliphilus]
MSLQLEPVHKKDKPILHNLYALFLHDISKYTNNLQINENGFFDYEDIHCFWDTEGISPYFIKIDQTLIGFLLLVERPFLKKQNDYGINDLFILNQYKGKGYGRMAVEKLFDEKKGQYFVIQVENNKPAVVFWRKVLQTSSLDLNEEKREIDGEQCLIQTFTIQ